VQSQLEAALIQRAGGRSSSSSRGSSAPCRPCSSCRRPKEVEDCIACHLQRASAALQSIHSQHQAVCRAQGRLLRLGHAGTEGAPILALQRHCQSPRRCGCCCRGGRRGAGRRHCCRHQAHARIEGWAQRRALQGAGRLHWHAHCGKGAAHHLDHAAAQSAVVWQEAHSIHAEL
jgi:hypothetical protein